MDAGICYLSEAFDRQKNNDQIFAQLEKMGPKVRIRVEDYPAIKMSAGTLAAIGRLEQEL